MRDLINQSKAWKYVGSVSAINGLICFGLSSTYKISFGKWGFGGLLDYVAIGLIMWCLILWGKRIRVSGKFQCLVATLIFIVICSISALHDKLVPGKSDPLSIISYGSFALMSLSMSRKFELGFETGFSGFFLSLFVTQLFKTNRNLLPVAFVFCLVIFVLRRNSESGLQFGSSSPSGYQQVEVGPPDAAIIEIGDEDTDEESQDSPGMEEVSGQSLLSRYSRQNSQEEPSEATHHSSGIGEVSEESTSDRGSEQNNQREQDPSSLPAESSDQDRVSSGNNRVTIQNCWMHSAPPAAPRELLRSSP